MLTITLETPVSELKGVGPATDQKLAALQIYTVEDLIHFYPARHEDFTLKDVRYVEHGEQVTVRGQIAQEPTVSFMGPRRSRLQFQLATPDALIRVIFFNQHYLKNKFTIGTEVTVSGKWDRGRQLITAQRYAIDEEASLDDFEPVYYLKRQLPQKTFRQLIEQGLEAVKGQVKETLPVELLQHYQLLTKEEALQMIHFPTSPEAQKAAYARFTYEELFFFQLKMMAMKQKRKQGEKGTIIDYDLAELKRFIESLPFEMTNAQKRVVNEICFDMKNDYRMNRLLQGDVGSGKTAVAAVTLYAAMTAGFQTAFMAPTEILAEQHAETLANWFEPFGRQVAFLSGSTKAKARRQLLERLASGDIDLLVGTHALIQPDVIFHRLGYVITDEQHRFGVNQRRALREKGENPDVLFMTATPIPRTLAITAFGEMDVSIIDELPAGRKPIDTRWTTENTLPTVLEAMERELASGSQAYVICPLVEESDVLDVQSAVDVHAQLTRYFGDRRTVGLMHGRLSSEEKDEVMRAFSEGTIDVLVSTTVVEVGVNVPNATFMVIYDATRFGLAQLHQLRGRVGRGSRQSYCVLIADPKNDEAEERMRSMVETNDGFVLAEKDLQLRGSGDFFGTKQSGLPEFHFADPQKDYQLLQLAQRDAVALLEKPFFWEEERFLPIREQLEKAGVFSGERID